MPEGVVEQLRSLGDRKASGELVCVCPPTEIHVYLHRGRVAWATDSNAPLAFKRGLIEEHGVSLDTYEEVLEECRTSRLPLGETLIEWQVATLEQVRSALLSQIRASLMALMRLSNSPALFLDRTYCDYSDELTFSVDKLLADLSSEAKAPDAASSSLGLQLSSARAQVPSCVMVAYLDLDSRTFLGLDTSDLLPQDVLTLAAPATAELLGGSAAEALRRVFGPKSPSESPHYLTEVVILSQRFLHLFIRSRANPRRAVAFVTPASANLGMTLTRARQCASEIESCR